MSETDLVKLREVADVLDEVYAQVEIANSLRLAADEVERLRGFIALEGYHQCDIPACNCNSFHGGYAGFRRRLSEIIEALGGCQGTTPLAEIQRITEEDNHE